MIKKEAVLIIEMCKIKQVLHFKELIFNEHVENRNKHVRDQSMPLINKYLWYLLFLQLNTAVIEAICGVIGGSGGRLINCRREEFTLRVFWQWGGCFKH